ncbi:MAG: DUF2971 domain-containing protein [Candidatus Omnitrophica bacterium]|nr:DUF2971 domain-containing protein [Candidatus Omnitrophota bacterium]
MNKFHDKDSFYKYVSANTAKQVLRTLKVRCSSPSVYNDPFDSQISIAHDLNGGGAEELIRRLTGHICSYMKPLIQGGDVEGAHNIVLTEIMKDEAFVADRLKAFESFYRDINEKILEFAREDRVFCVSEINDNLLMWSHYANDHKGVVIKLRCVPEKNSALCAAKPVKYSSVMPVLRLEDLFLPEETLIRKILNDFLLTKSIDWQYEQEWRVILSSQEAGKEYDLRGIFPEELAAIYFGCRVSNQDKSEILEVIRSAYKDVKVFQMEKDSKEFRLNAIAL